MTPQDHPLTAEQVVPFLRSVIASGERLRAEDVTAIERALEGVSVPVEGIVTPRHPDTDRPSREEFREVLAQMVLAAEDSRHTAAQRIARIRDLAAGVRLPAEPEAPDPIYGYQGTHQWTNDGWKPVPTPEPPAEPEYGSFAWHEREQRHFVGDGTIAAAVWVAADGEHVQFQHVCNGDPKVDTLTNSIWPVPADGHVKPSIHCTLCGFHEFMTIGPRPALMDAIEAASVPVAAPTEPHPGHPVGQWACAESCVVPASVPVAVTPDLRAALETLLIQHHGPRHGGRYQDCSDYGCSAAAAALAGAPSPDPVAVTPDLRAECERIVNNGPDWARHYGYKVLRAALAGATSSPAPHVHELIHGAGVAPYCRDCGATPPTDDTPDREDDHERGDNELWPGEGD